MNRVDWGQVAGWSLLTGLGATLIYRGCTQSVTVDEAYMYHLFLNQPWEALWDRYDACHHVLHTWATKLAVFKFGKSEAILRLPSMLAGIAYLAGVGILCARLLGKGWAFLAGCVVLGAHPLVGDYLSAARGYGMALAYLVWGIVALMRQREVLGGILLGLAAATNLTFAPVGIASLVCFALLAPRMGADSRIRVGARMAIAYAVVFTAIVGAPLGHASAEHFYFGADNWRTSLDTLTAATFGYNERIGDVWRALFFRFGIPLLSALQLILVPFLWRAGAWFATLLSSTFVLNCIAYIVGCVFSRFRSLILL